MTSTTSATITFTVLFFASAREAVASPSLTFTLPALPPPTVRLVVSHIVAKHNKLKPLMRHMLLAVNQEYASVDSDRVLNGSEEIAFIPPLSGG